MTDGVRWAASDGVAVLTLDAPERRNALDGPMARECMAAISAIEADADVGALIVTGAPPAFCAGANRDLLTRAGNADDVAARADLDAIYELFLRLGSACVPTVAAVGGAAVGAGLNLALSADVCVVATDALLMSGFLRIDLHPGGGHHLLLRRRAGLTAANAMALFDQPVDGRRAVELGLAWTAVDSELVLDTALELARGAGAKPAVARLAARTLRRSGEGWNWPAQLEAERGAQLATLLARNRMPVQ